MIILFLIICIFFFLICSKLIKSLPLKLIIFVMFVILMQYMILFARRCYVRNIPKVDTNTLYNNLKHGDIVFTSNKNRLQTVLLSMNYGMSHIMLVIEKEGQKYLLHAYPNQDKDPEYCLDDKHMFGLLGGPSMRLFLEPAMLMILGHYDKMNYQVFRPSTPLKNNVTPQIESKQFNLANYCTRALSKTLVDNDIIDADSTVFFKYRPEQIIHQLVKKNVPCFFMTHE